MERAPPDCGARCGRVRDAVGTQTEEAIILKDLEPSLSSSGRSPLSVAYFLGSGVIRRRGHGSRLELAISVWPSAVIGSAYSWPVILDVGDVDPPAGSCRRMRRTRGRIADRREARQSSRRPCGGIAEARASGALPPMGRERPCATAVNAASTLNLWKEFRGESRSSR